MAEKSPWALVRLVHLLLFPVLLILSAPAQAADPDLLSLSVGYYDQDWIDPDILYLNHGDSGHFAAVDYRLEYRFGTSLIPWTDPYVKIKPFVGIEGTSELGFYGLGGLLFDIALGPVVITPSFGAGLYSQGNGKDLGSLLEFRTQLEIGYKFENEMRVTVAYSHISNANLTDLNPGVDIISAYLHVPVRMIIGN
jgi:lipid A 3-O-deacylase